MAIHQITFSPTGGTKKVCQMLCQGFGQESIHTELCVPADAIQVPTIEKDDLVVVAMPVFGGRIPALAAERLRNIPSHGARCAVVAVYGNRAYDDALLEMQDLCTELGFRVIAAIGAVAEHSIIRQYGVSRPDAGDAEVLRRFAADIWQKMKSANDSTPCVRGSHPYKKAMKGPVPKGNNRCNGCGLCAKNCPVGAIPIKHPKRVDKEKCIACMKCVSNCPQGARSIGCIMHFLIAQAIKKPCASHKQNELFL